MSILQTKTGRRGALEIHIDELRKEFKKEAKEHSDNWMLLYSYNKGSINRFCYDGMAVDDALKLLTKTAKMFHILSRRVKGRKKKLTSRK